MLTTQTANVHIRWMTRAELPYVLDIERRSFPAHAWGEEAFLGEAMGVCKERVRQIDRQAIARLAAMLAGVRGC